MPKTRTNARKSRRMRGGNLSEVLPTTTWGQWATYPGALVWGANNAQAPPPLANGGLYTGQQSTGAWASSPFPATQYGWAVGAAEAAKNPDVFYQQRPNDNSGASFSPYVGSPASPSHYSATMGAKIGGGRRRKNRRQTRRQKGGAPYFGFSPPSYEPRR